MTSHPIVKINLGLNVLRKRSDGFHDIETLFYPCDAFSDTLTIEPCKGEFNISIDGPCYTGWDPAKDLCARAYALLKEDFGIPPVSIRLTKTSPVGAGLGGGSSDCAQTLLMLSDIFCLGLSKDTLASYASRLGSDCAFFIYNTPMFAQGRGEVLSPFELSLEGCELRVQIPQGVAVSTREAYAGITPAVPSKGIREILQLPVEQWREHLHNDFEDSVFPLHPQIAALKEKMYLDGALYAAMSGSGSAVFGIFRR